MSEPEKPLHVRVAEALGCKARPLEDGPNEPIWWCYCNGDDGCPAAGYITGGSVLRYDTDWAATGPLIEKYVWSVNRISKGGSWQAVAPWYAAEGPTPLIAVCNLILALKEAGKLNA